jgi:adenosylhomocysteine nucleosidase
LNPLGIVAALAAEARALGPAVKRMGDVGCLGDGTLLAVSGMGCAAAGRAAGRLIEAGASALMSFGLAGGLDPRLSAGSVVLPSEVISRDGAGIATSVDWRERLAAALASPRRASPAAPRPVAGGKLLTSAQAIDSVADKAAAFRDTGAVAVDMESLAVAQAAAAHRLPFMAVRVIVDTAADALPRAVAAASQGGQVRIWPLIGALALSPSEFAAIIRLAIRYRTATRSLAAVARAVLPAHLDTQVRAA